MKKRILLGLCLVFVASGLFVYQQINKDDLKNIYDSSVVKKTTEEKQGEQLKQESTLLKVDQLIKRMTLKEKIGQLFIIRPDALDSNLTIKKINNTTRYGIKSVNSRMIDTILQYPVGGIVMFGKNITIPKELTAYTKQLQDASTIPLFMGIDEEGGTVSRIANAANFKVKKYENMTAIGNTKDPQQAKSVGNTIGSYLNKYGFNLDFAPVADVNTNPKNPVIGTRSFGNDPQLVQEMVRAAVEGFHEAHIMTSIKHFPGHGDTKTDTHHGYAVTYKTWNQMKACEIIPFESGIKAQSDMIMVSHITAVNVTTDNLPASLSKQMVTHKLRNELGYNGIIITDSLSMEAITKQYNAKQAAIKAIQAGNDILLMPENYKLAFEGLIEAVNNGTIEEKRIDESVKRILQLKDRNQLL